MREAPRYRLAGIVGLAGLVIVAGARAHAADEVDGPSIEWQVPAMPSDELVVAGLPATAGAWLEVQPPDWDGWRRLLSVRVLPRRDGTPPVGGRYRWQEERLHFKPRFPWKAGQQLEATWNPAEVEWPHAMSTKASRQEFRIAEPQIARPPTEVTGISPPAGLVPQNILKFYATFSAPMSRGGAYANIRLESAAGEPLEFPFVELAEELWDPTGQRLTLLLDPARIKHGLRPREEQGPFWNEGDQVVLCIAAGWPDAAGRPLASEYRQCLSIGPADEVSPDPLTWDVELPAAAGRDPLRIAADEPLDEPLFVRRVTVLGPDGEVVQGVVEVSPDQTGWTLMPDSAWLPGDYTLEIDPRLEDLCGNSVGRPFEVRRADADGAANDAVTLDQPSADEPVRLMFILAPAPH